MYRQRAITAEADLAQRCEALRITLSRIEGHLADVGTVNTEAEVGVLQLAQRCAQAEARVKWLEEGRKYVMPSKVTLKAFYNWLDADPTAVEGEKDDK